MKQHPLAVIPRHNDGSLCGHGPADACPGTGDLLALCACGWHTAGTVRLGLAALHGEHARVLMGGGR